MLSIQSTVYPAECEPVDHQSINSWESDQTPTPSEEDLKFNKKFANYNNKTQHDCHDSACLCEDCSSAASEGLQGYKGSDDGREEEDDDARTFVDWGRKSSTNVSIEVEAKSESVEAQIINHPQIINLDQVRMFKDTRLYSINRSLSVTSVGNNSLQNCSEVLKLPEINCDGHEPQKMEGYAAWGLLDSLLPAPATSEKEEAVNPHLISCTDQCEEDIENQRPKFYGRINASFYSSDDSSATLSQDGLDTMVDDMVEGMLEEIYDEFFEIYNPYFEHRVQKALTNHESVGRNYALSEPTSPVSPTIVEPSIQSIKVYKCDSDTEEEVFERAAEAEVTDNHEELVDKVPEVKTAQNISAPVCSDNDEVLFCKKHQEYVAIKEVIYNNSKTCCFGSKDQDNCDGANSDQNESVCSYRRNGDISKDQCFEEGRQSCEDSLTNFIDLKVHMMNMDNFVDFDCSFVNGQMQLVDTNKYASIELCMSVNDNFSKVKSFMAKNSDMRIQIMSGFFLIDGVIFDPSQENVKFHKLNLKPTSKIILVRQLVASETFKAPEARLSC